MRLWRITRFGALVAEVIAPSAQRAKSDVAFYHNLPRTQLTAAAVEDD